MKQLLIEYLTQVRDAEIDVLSFQATGHLVRVTYTYNDGNISFNIEATELIEIWDVLVFVNSKFDKKCS